MRKIFQIISATLIVLSSVLLNFQSTSAKTCNDVEFIFARGSGEALHDKSEKAWREAISSQLASSNLRYDFYELGESSHGGAQYPAVTVSGADGFGNLLGAYFSAGEAFNFGKSVVAGATELKAYIAEVSAICPKTKFVLGGYSQGAMLISRTLDEIAADKIIYVATFGDPKLFLPEGAGKTPVACAGKNLSNYRAYVPDCHAYEGILGGYQPYQPKDYHDKLGTWCNGKDIMCSSGMAFVDHSKYISRGLYQNAAHYILDRLQKAFPEKTLASPDASEINPHDVVILLNVSSATLGILNQYRIEAERVAHEVYSLGGRVALYTYSDSLKLKSQLRCDFSCSASEFDQALLKGTQIWSTGESVDATLSTLYTAMETLEWRVGATKSAVVISPRGFDRVDRDGTTLDDVVELSLKIDPVNVYAITSDETTKQQYLPLTSNTNGQAYIISKESETALAEIFNRPAPSLALESYAGVVGEEINFSAVTTSNATQPQFVRYDWDLDADNVFETADAGPQVTKIYQQPISGFVQVRVTDASGLSSTMSAHLEISAQAPEMAEITRLEAVSKTATSYEVTVATNAKQVLLSFGDAPLGFLDVEQTQTFTIDDIISPIELRVTPYSEIGMRGEAKTITLGKPQPENSEKPSTIHDQPVGSVPIHQPWQYLSLPKVPNSGVGGMNHAN